MKWSPYLSLSLSLSLSFLQTLAAASLFSCDPIASQYCSRRTYMVGTPMKMVTADRHRCLSGWLGSAAARSLVSLAHISLGLNLGRNSTVAPLYSAQ